VVRFYPRNSLHTDYLPLLVTPCHSVSWVTPARPQRSDTDLKVAELLRTAKKALGLSLTFLTRLDGEIQHLEVVESSIPFFHDGQTQPQSTSLCQAILDGKLPSVIPNVAKLPEAKRLPAARFPRIRSYVSVPVSLSDGTLYGTFCAAGFAADNDLSKRDRALMEVLASAAATIIEPGVQERRREAVIRSRLEPILDASGPSIVLQPIVTLGGGIRVGAEALSRFPAEWGQAPDEVFADAASIGIGRELEILAVRRAADDFIGVSGYLSINFSAQTLLDVRCQELLRDLPLERIVVELSEHDPVDDYRILMETLNPLRKLGLRLAIDDVGAGFSSLRHILLTSPDVIKLDRSIVAGVADDPVLRRLVQSLAEFGHDAGATVVAEGVEISDDASALRDAGVDYGQGWYFARPGPALQLADSYQVDEILV
jgi:EAL domain-containing protein (putative c-di-GMP-specific phosphodiesterase class I)